LARHKLGESASRGANMYAKRENKKKKKKSTSQDNDSNIREKGGAQSERKIGSECVGVANLSTGRNNERNYAKTRNTWRKGKG